MRNRSKRPPAAEAPSKFWMRMSVFENLRKRWVFLRYFLAIWTDKQKKSPDLLWQVIAHINLTRNKSDSGYSGFLRQSSLPEISPSTLASKLIIETYINGNVHNLLNINWYGKTVNPLVRSCPAGGSSESAVNESSVNSVFEFTWDLFEPVVLLEELSQ